MTRRLIFLVAALAAVAGLACAQIGGGQSGGGHRGHGGRGKPSSDSSPTNAAAPTPKAALPKPMNQIEIVGVVRAVDPGAKSVTIAYDAVEALGWPHGTQPFSVYTASLLENVTVGEKVRFKLDGQRIADLKPF